MYRAADVVELLHDIEPKQHLQEHDANGMYVPPGSINQRRLVLHIFG